MTKKYDVTVLICVHSTNYNYDFLLMKSLKSLENQTYKNFKTLLVLDECWDNTKKIITHLFSMRLMALAMLVFLVAIGWATILESKFDIQTAKILVYNARWFEVLLVYLMFNLIANIIRYKMVQREKIAMLTFHLSFIIILISLFRY